MKIMISQPMRGKTEKEIKDEREQLINKLQEEGHEVLETVFNDFDCYASPIAYLARSIEYLDKADAVIFMPGWNEARGCRIEYQIACEYGKFIKIL
ncbi:MAG: DUF4406 domain-containing protein [Clostridia bacterium]|nr:DUF4406 domain-containing protein [Clostridia bacterium]